MESIVIAFLGYVTTLIVGFYSADRTAGASKESVHETFQEQRQLDRDRQEKMIEGVLYAIYEELDETCKQLNSPEIEYGWKEYENSGKKLFQVYYPVPLDYLIIYRANANLIGQIDEPSELRRKIVSSYMLLQTLMERYKRNNALLAQYQETKDRGEPDSYNMGLFMQFADTSRILQKEHKLFKRSTRELFDILIEKLPQLSNQGSGDGST